MSARRPWTALVIARRPWILACALALSVGLGACGEKGQPVSTINNGIYVTSGPITYQLQVSRELNQNLIEDQEYLAGLPLGTGALGPNQLWYGVFLWAKNQTEQVQTTANRFDILDSSNHRYYPIRVNAELNAYAWTPQRLPPSGVQPIPNSTAFYGPTQGNLLLFKLPTSVYSNRPLTLQIFGGSTTPGQISLDL